MWRHYCIHCVGKCLPEDGRIIHILWALHFMKNYPKQQGGCASAGGSSGAIDPKTYSKYLWPFIDAIAYVEQHLVSDVDLLYD